MTEITVGSKVRRTDTHHAQIREVWGIRGTSAWVSSDALPDGLAVPLSDLEMVEEKFEEGLAYVGRWTNTTFVVKQVRDDIAIGYKNGNRHWEPQESRCHYVLPEEES